MVDLHPNETCGFWVCLGRGGRVRGRGRGTLAIRRLSGLVLSHFFVPLAPLLVMKMNGMLLYETLEMNGMLS